MPSPSAIGHTDQPGARGGGATRAMNTSSGDPQGPSWRLPTPERVSKQWNLCLAANPHHSRE